MTHFCDMCRRQPCRCVEVCQGCDRAVPPNNWCESCGEFVQTYLWDKPAPALTDAERLRVAELKMGEAA